MKKPKKIIDAQASAEHAIKIFLIALLFIFIIKLILTGRAFTQNNINPNNYEIYERGSGGAGGCRLTQAKKKFCFTQSSCTRIWK
jgi:hypothetical protein